MSAKREQRRARVFLAYGHSMPSPACGAGDSIKPGVKRSGTPG